MWLINIVLLQLPAKEGFPVIRLICHESVIDVAGYVSHRGIRPPSSHYKTVRNYLVSQQTELTAKRDSTNINNSCDI